MYLNICQLPTDPTANVSTIKPAVEGTNVTIPCSIYPAADVAYVTWLMDDTIINTNNSEKYVGGSIASPSLDILFVNENDEGNYTCQVTNPVGTGKSDILHLNVVEGNIPYTAFWKQLIFYTYILYI